ncbi:MAG TPA: response regulator transcription factor [Anaerolineales bacterium]|nr:response regulator transcription factor [Anaerolineales bacterium]
MSEYSILLVEDHAGFAKALLNMLGQNQELKVVAVAQDGEDALQLLQQLKVDLALVDFSLPDMTGVELLEKLHQEYPDLRCAILSGHLLPQHARRALATGARGYLIKDDPMGILTGIQHILKGEIYVSEELRDLGLSDLLTDLT